MLASMQIRPVTASDLEGIAEIDGTVESSRYLHIDRTGEGLAAGWHLEERPARQKVIEANRMPDEAAFFLRQVATAMDEGIALLVEHEAAPVAMLLARPDPAAGTVRIVDLRVDYDYRRQGMGTALVFQLIQYAREHELRAVAAETLTNNLPASGLLNNCGFELSGVDT